MIYTTYHPVTGEIQSTLTITDPVQANAILENQSFIVGSYHRDQYKIINGQPISLPPKPQDPIKIYVYDYVSDAWILDQRNTIKNSRQHRDRLLSRVDQVNPVRFASLTGEQQTELADYRLALLAVPQQSGFPAEVIWPEPPTWL